MQSQNDVNKLSGLCTVSSVWNLLQLHIPQIVELWDWWEQNEAFHEHTAYQMRSYTNNYLLMGLWVNVAFAFSLVTKYIKLAVYEFLLSLVWTHCGAGVSRDHHSPECDFWWYLSFLSHWGSYKFFKIIAT